jgi:catechol 2,3-dioxygenase-like lactoylglutathione lyase family enzyme
MSTKARLIGIELYFDNLPAARRFYQDTLGLELLEEDPGHHAKFEGQSAFICLERKGAESYPSQDKAVVFFEVEDLESAVEGIGIQRFAGLGPRDKAGRISWAVIHDPEGHNVLLLQREKTDTR